MLILGSEALEDLTIGLVVVRRCYNSEVGFVSFWGLVLVILPATAQRFRSAIGAIADVHRRVVMCHVPFL